MFQSSSTAFTPGLADLFPKYLIDLLQLHKLCRLKYWGDSMEAVGSQYQVFLYSRKLIN